MSWREPFLVAAAVAPVGAALATTQNSESGQPWTFAAAGAGTLLAACLVRNTSPFSLSAAAGLAAIVGLGLWMELAVSWAWLPEGALIEAARWLAIAAGIAAAGLAAGESTRARQAILYIVAGCCVAVTLHTGLPALGQGVPEERLRGVLGYWNASAACAAVTMLIAMRVGQGTRAAAVSPILASTAGLCLAATLSRGALYATVLGLAWLLIQGRYSRGVLFNASMAVTSGAWGLIAGPRLDGWLVGLGVLFLCLTTVLWPTSQRSRPRARRWPTRRPMVVGCLCLGLVASGLLAATQGDVLRSPIPDRSSGRLLNPSLNVRWQWWKEAADTWRRAPMIGKGGNAFAVRKDIPRGPYFPAARPHNLALELLVGGGLIAFALFACAAFLVGRELLRHTRVARQSGEAPPLEIAIVLVLMLQAAFDWTLSVATVGAITAAFIGLALSRPKRLNDQAHDARRLFVDTMWGPAAVAALALCAVPLLARAAAHEADRSGVNPGRARWSAAVAWQLAPSGQSLAVRVRAVEASEGRERAREELRLGLRRLREDRIAWSAAAGIAEAWSDSALLNEAIQRSHELDPALRAAGSAPHFSGSSPVHDQ